MDWYVGLETSKNKRVGYTRSGSSQTGSELWNSFRGKWFPTTKILNLPNDQESYYVNWQWKRFSTLTCSRAPHISWGCNWDHKCSSFPLQLQFNHTCTQYKQRNALLADLHLRCNTVVWVSSVLVRALIKFVSAYRIASRRKCWCVVCWRCCNGAVGPLMRSKARRTPHAYELIMAQQFGSEVHIGMTRLDMWGCWEWLKGDGRVVWWLWVLVVVADTGCGGMELKINSKTNWRELLMVSDW